ncbi:MAG: hypothetical protein FGM54_02125 [Chitinophagaceae bacterium]|nr:hypothetical protein [Chitinophagaceae bacterium]
MLNVFQFEIVRDDLRLRYMQSRAIHAMAALFMLLYAMQYLINSPSWLYKLMLFPPPIILLLLIIFKRNMFEDLGNLRMFRILEIGILCMGALHFLQKNNEPISALYTLVAGIVGLIFYMETRLFMPQFILFNQAGILIPGIWRTHKIAWNEIEGVVLKSPHLTILKPSGRFWQWRIEPRFQPDFQADFMAFCQKQQAL